MCEVEFVGRFAEVVPLERLRAEKSLAGMQILQRGNRLSITPLTEAEFEAIRRLGGASPAQARATSRAALQSAPKPAASAKGRGR